MSEWVTLPLTDVMDFREGPGVLAKDFRDEGVPLVRLAGLKVGAAMLKNCNYLDPARVATRWAQFKLELGDVLLSSSASLGEVATVNESAVGAIPYTGIIAFRSSDDRLRQRFIPFLLTAPTFKQQIQEMGVGSVMKHFGPSHLRQMNVSLPPLPDQDGIAEVLGALDDKIAVNRNIADLSNDLATTLFDQALVHADWSTSTFDDIANVSGGGTPSTKLPEYWDGEVSWATPTDITNLDGPYLFTTGRRISEAGLRACASPLYNAGSILMTSRATIGAFAIADVPTAVNQGFIVVVPTDPTLKWWIFHEMRSRVDEFISLANGATFLELSRGNFRRLKIRLAPESTMLEFSIRAESLHAVARAVLSENRTLAATRDALLPQLMSGKLRVRDAERTLEGVL
jgi:type I restriction enzyme S subunit